MNQVRWGAWPTHPSNGVARSGWIDFRVAHPTARGALTEFTPTLSRVGLSPGEEGPCSSGKANMSLDPPLLVAPWRREPAPTPPLATASSHPPDHQPIQTESCCHSVWGGRGWIMSGKAPNELFHSGLAVGGQGGGFMNPLLVRFMNADTASASPSASRLPVCGRGRG